MEVDAGVGPGVGPNVNPGVGPGVDPGVGPGVAMGVGPSPFETFAFGEPSGTVRAICLLKTSKIRLEGLF